MMDTLAKTHVYYADEGEKLVQSQCDSQIFTLQCNRIKVQWFFEGPICMHMYILRRGSILIHPCMFGLGFNLECLSVVFCVC